MRTAIALGVVLVAFAAASLGQTAQPQSLSSLEQIIAEQFNEQRRKASLQPLKVRQDIRLRMEACSVQVKGPDSKVEHPSESTKYWYMTADPSKSSNELMQLARIKTSYGHVAVGVWFAKTEAYPEGMYWVVVYPENSAAHEAFWSHFYLTDDFEYQTIFDKYWKKQLPQVCRSIK